MKRTIEFLYDTALLDLMPMAVYVIDLDGLIRSFNKKACDFWGQTPKLMDADAIYCGALALYHPDGTAMPMAHTPMAAAVLEGKTCQNGEVVILRPDGTRITVLVNISPLWDEAGKIVGAINAFQDITEVVEGRKKIIFQNEQLEIRDSFLSLCSHELKTPLTSLKFQTELAKRKIEKGDDTVYDRERVAKMIKQTDRQVSRLNHLVDDMLDLHRIKSGKLTMHPEKTELVALIKDVVSNNVSGSDDGGARVSIHAEEPVEGMFDRYRIEQVVTNLVTNAVKYGGEAPIRIEVEKVGESARIRVHDKGMGVAEADHGRIFERFERAASETNISGLGLGLYVTRQIVEAHRGNIQIRSALGKGSTFSVELPLKGLCLN